MASIKELQAAEMAASNRLYIESQTYQKSVVKTERDLIYLQGLRDQQEAMRTHLLELMEIDVEALLAERDAFRARVSELETPDMFWNADDPESGVWSDAFGAIQDHIDINSAVGDEIKVQVARWLTPGVVRIVGTDTDDDGEEQWLVKYIPDEVKQ